MHFMHELHSTGLTFLTENKPFVITSRLRDTLAGFVFRFLRSSQRCHHSHSFLFVSLVSCPVINNLLTANRLIVLKGLLVEDARVCVASQKRCHRWLAGHKKLLILFARLPAWLQVGNKLHTHATPQKRIPRAKKH